MLDHETAVLHHLDAPLRQAGGGVVVADAQLEPHGARQGREAQNLVHVCGNMTRWGIGIQANACPPYTVIPETSGIQSSFPLEVVSAYASG